MGYCGDALDSSVQAQLNQVLDKPDWEQRWHQPEILSRMSSFKIIKANNSVVRI